MGSKNASNAALKQALLATCLAAAMGTRKNQKKKRKEQKAESGSGNLDAIGINGFWESGAAAQTLPLEDDKSSSSPKELGTLVQRTCAGDLTRLRPWGLANFEGFRP